MHFYSLTQQFSFWEFLLQEKFLLQKQSRKCTKIWTTGNSSRWIFATVKNGKEPKYPTIRDWLDKLGPIKTMPGTKMPRGHQRQKERLKYRKWLGKICIQMIYFKLQSHKTVWHVPSLHVYLYIYIFLICNILQKLADDKQPGNQWKSRTIVIIITYLLGFFIFFIAFQVAQW